MILEPPSGCIFFRKLGELSFFFSKCIAAKYFLIDNLSMELGPQLSFLVNSDFEFDGDTSVSIEPKDLYKKMDFGLNFGLSYKLNKIFFSGRYNLGLTQLLEGELVQDIIQHNRGFQFSVGYMF